MKLKTIAKSIIALSAAFVLVACGNNASSSASSSNAQSSESELKTVKISSVGSDADIWRHIADTYKDLTNLTQTNSFQWEQHISNQWGFTLKR